MDSPEERETESNASPEPAALESPLKPLMWLLIPFVLLLLYGYFGS